MYLYLWILHVTCELSEPQKNLNFRKLRLDYNYLSILFKHQNAVFRHECDFLSKKCKPLTSPPLQSFRWCFTLDIFSGLDVQILGKKLISWNFDSAQVGKWLAGNFSQKKSLCCYLFLISSHQNTHFRS